jgi:leucyl aminopeptidase
MTDFASLLQPNKGQAATALHLIDKPGLEPWLAGQPQRVRQAATAQGFKGEAHQIAIIPGEMTEWSALVGVGEVAALGPWCLAKAAETLSEGTYRLAGSGPSTAALGWLLGQYRFDRYKSDPSPKGPRILLTDEPARIDDMVSLADATSLVRDLVNLPAGDLGPAELERAVRDVASASGASVTTTQGEKLRRMYPMIAAVGQAAEPAREPRLVELEWGDPKHPRIAIVGKGVVFDTGGLDIKPASGMRLMKKDMGGAAHALALASLIMRHRLPVRLHLLIPAVENAIAGAAFRPGDILKSRNGLTVEIGNTDAEGRLILADAIAKAVEGKPELLLDFATLTGAARVALGPDLPALFANNDSLAADLLSAGQAVDDPVWRMPLWKGYHELFASDVADFSNASESPFAGAVTAALFLAKFVPDTLPWAHLDTFAWRPTAKPGRLKGGEALGLRAAWSMLQARYGG